MSIDLSHLPIQAVSFDTPVHNPCLRSELQGKMACKFNEHITIDGKPFMLDCAFEFYTPDFWQVSSLAAVNHFHCYDTSNTQYAEAFFTDDQKLKILDALACQISYDTYHWFTTVKRKPAPAQAA